MDKPLSKTILVVDDNDLNRRLVRVTLGKLGFEVVEAENGPLALAMVNERNIDLVLLDVGMPDMDGIAVLASLRQEYTVLELPVIMFTADDKQERIVEALTLGANDYLLKPLDPAIAAARIRTQLSIACLSKLKDKVVRFASHDLKKPMLVMQDIIETLRGMSFEQPGEREEMHEYLGLLDQTSQRMQDVVYGFLDQDQFKISQAPEERRLDLNAEIEEAHQVNSLYAEKKNTWLELELASSLPELRADGFKIRQVLDNLIGNAIKFCPQGSRVIVRSRLHGNTVRVEVEDNGPGLTDADRQRLFVHNGPLSNKPTGGETSSGVGLPLCRDLIEAAGGHIGAHSESGKGATFWFSLPLPDPMATLTAGSSCSYDQL